MNTELLAENRSRGWADASNAPDWAKNRILEIRNAIVEKRSVPAPSSTYLAEAEKRFVNASTFLHRLFPSRRNEISVQALMRKTDAELLAIMKENCAPDDPRYLRMLANHQAAVMRADSFRTTRTAPRVEKPDYLLNAQEREDRKRFEEIRDGKRPSEDELHRQYYENR